MKYYFILIALFLLGCDSDFQQVGGDFLQSYWCDKEYGIMYIKSGHGLSARYDSTGLPLRCEQSKGGSK